MKKLNFSTNINAPKEKVWSTLWNDATYRAWTSAFAEGSYAKTDDWKEGSNILFLDGKGNGMVSMVSKNKPNEYMSFKHIGVVKEGVEDTSSEAVKGWSGAMENYALKEENGKTTLLVEMDATDEFSDYLEKTWPKALEKLKSLAELN
ncbi:MAG TPA: SRPBCC domain-containing protein [Chitinophagaceae bacterium]|nr:SRPBCC domain-containing protein [Chitinophagaceae bacterium]